MKKILVYICSPYADGDIEMNTAKAILYSRKCFEAGNVPVTPHLLYPRFINEKTERQNGLNCALELLMRCDVMWVCGDRITEGMSAEINIATDCKIPIYSMFRDLNNTGKKAN